MPYSFYGPNTRSDFLCYFLDMATPIKSVIDGHSKGFCSSDLLTSKSLIANVGDSVRVLSLCLDPIRINSVCVMSLNYQKGLPSVGEIS